MGPGFSISQHSPGQASLGGSHPNLLSLECYRPAKMFPYLPHAASHSMDADVGSCLCLFWGEALGASPTQQTGGQS